MTDLRNYPPLTDVHGQPLEPGSQYIRTGRSIENDFEDHSYVPVIIKRTDEVMKDPDDTLEKAIHEGSAQLKRRTLSLFLSAVTAGLILGFTALLVAFAHELADTPNIHLRQLVIALFYPLGFIVCIMSGTQLFTEHTATALYPVLDGRASVFRLWSLVLVGNVVGTFLGSCLISVSDNSLMITPGYCG